MAANGPCSKAAKRAAPKTFNALFSPIRTRPKKDIKASRHSMTTRQRSRAFQLMALPPEIRAYILHLVIKTRYRHSLIIFQVPPIMHVNQKLRLEATPIFFSSTKFTALVETNWCRVPSCVWSTVQAHYETTGKVRVSRRLPDPDRPTTHFAPTIAANMIRLRDVHLTVNIGCGMPSARPSRMHGQLTGFRLGNLELSVHEGKTFVLFKVRDARPDLSVAMLVFQPKIDEIKELCKGFETRDPFNGFTIKDIKDIAMMFRV